MKADCSTCKWNYKHSPCNTRLQPETSDGKPCPYHEAKR